MRMCELRDLTANLRDLTYLSFYRQKDLIKATLYQLLYTFSYISLQLLIDSSLFCHFFSQRVTPPVILMTYGGGEQRLIYIGFSAC